MGNDLHDNHCETESVFVLLYLPEARHYVGRHGRERTIVTVGPSTAVSDGDCVVCSRVGHGSIFACPFQFNPWMDPIHV